MIENITTSLVRRGKSDMTSYDASITGGLFDMAAGRVQMAAGLEYREESISDMPDDQFQRGLIFGTEAVAAPPRATSRRPTSSSRCRLLESLELSLAGRYDDYSDFGDTTNPKVALRWSPIDSLAFRASWGTGFRAPSLAQVGLGPRMIPVLHGHFRLRRQWARSSACEPLDYTVVISGNPDLKRRGIGDLERRRSLAAERHVARLGGLLGYRAGGQDRHSVWRRLHQQLQQSGEHPFARAGRLSVATRWAHCNGVRTVLTNIGEQSVTGIDLGASFATDLGAGALTLGLEYSHLLEFEKVELNFAGTGIRHP